MSRPRPSLLPLRAGALVFLSLGGGLGLTLCDRVHLSHGVLTQVDRSLFDQAWWVFPSFVLVSAGALLGFRALRVRRGWRPRGFYAGRALLGIAWFHAVYALTGPLGRLDGWLAFALVLLWGLRLLVRPDRLALQFSLALAVVGPLLEAANVALGNFAYLTPDLGLVPSWLPAIYLHGGLMVARLEPLLEPC